MHFSENDKPVRSFMNDKNIIWKTKKPNYDVVDDKYMKEKTKSHKTSSLEKTVENLVKTWEMESSHKINEKDWETIDKDHFRVSANGGKKYTLQDNIEIGNYNMLLDSCPLYNASAETNESSHEVFREAFRNGYAWELLDVFSGKGSQVFWWKNPELLIYNTGPPIITFTWRHWGTFEGTYRDVSPTNETLEMFGTCVVKVTDQLKIQSLEVYYDPNPTMSKLTGFQTSHGNGCPFALKKKNDI